MDLKIASWNVNGIRSVTQKGFFDWLSANSPDVVCLQETKAKPEQLDGAILAPFGYQTYWASAEKPGYSGVAIFTKHSPKAVRVGLNGGLSNEAFDREGRVLEIDLYGITIINSYFPNSQRDHARLGYKLDFCDAMFKRLHRPTPSGKAEAGKTQSGSLQKGIKNKIILCGDLNIAHKPIDLRNPKANENNAGYLPEERQWAEKLINSGYVDAFRQFEPGAGHYTWWSYRPGVREKNIGWRLDYHFVDPTLKDQVVGCSIQPEVMGSDHCPVMLKVSL